MVSECRGYVRWWSGIWTSEKVCSLASITVVHGMAKLDNQGIEPWTSRMRSVRATTVPIAHENGFLGVHSSRPRTTKTFVG